SGSSLVRGAVAGGAAIGGWQGRAVTGDPAIRAGRDRPVSAAWLAVLVVGAATIALKAAGPVLAGERELPEPGARVVHLLAPALLAALVATQAFAADEALVLDERAAGLAAGAVAVMLKAPLLVVVVVAAATAAVLRLVA
ncbi:MAG: AzlD domain-containing protein, partial [Thermoleophilaceae bacterium]